MNTATLCIVFLTCILLNPISCLLCFRCRYNECVDEMRIGQCRYPLSKCRTITKDGFPIGYGCGYGPLGCEITKNGYKFCFCDSDLCNGSRRQKKSNFYFILFFLFVYLILR